MSFMDGLKSFNLKSVILRFTERRYNMAYAEKTSVAVNETKDDIEAAYKTGQMPPMLPLLNYGFGKV